MRTTWEVGGFGITVGPRPPRPRALGWAMSAAGQIRGVPAERPRCGSCSPVPARSPAIGLSASWSPPGHGVLAACRGDGRYEGLRAERVRMVRELCETRFRCAFGNDNFLGLTKTSFDVLCHHGAEVGDYRSPDFDPYRAAAANLHRLPEALAGVAGPRLRAPDADRQRLRGERGGGLGAAARLQPLRA